MLRRLNYTSRKRLALDHARISLRQSDGAWGFDAVLGLQNLTLPPTARVFVEAYRRMDWMRFYFGTVGALAEPPDRRLTRFETPSSILFRVRVVSPDGSPSGKLLAEADRISPTTPQKTDKGRRTLLSVQPTALDGELFRLDLSGDPVSLVERSVGELWESTASSLVFQALVYPTVLREILATMVTDWPDEDETDGWRGDWARLARGLPGFEPPPSGEDETSMSAWIDARVSSFCRQFRILDLFNAAWTQGGNL